MSSEALWRALALAAMSGFIAVLVLLFSTMIDNVIENKNDIHRLRLQLLEHEHSRRHHREESKRHSRMRAI